MHHKNTRRATSLGYRVSRLYRLNSCLLDCWLNEHHFSSGQIPYIMATVEKPGQTQEQLSAYIRVCPAAIARTLKNMEASGLVRRDENPENRRQKLVYPTSEAEALYSTLIPILDRHNEVMLEGFSDEEKVQIGAMLDRIATNVQKELIGERDK
nr:MarR family transcriptional regulator [uncultured Pseudodesulfovibrio sp.]